MKIAFYGSSLLSSYWNGAATYYRGLLQALAGHGHEITFYEPDVYDRQKNRDIEPPEWCKVVVYDGTLDALKTVAAEAVRADVVVKTSGVGYEDDALLAHVFEAARPDSIKIFWDVDAPATLADDGHALRKMLPRLDMVLTYGGGDPVIDAYRAQGARFCAPIYNALDPATHHPVESNPGFNADLGFLGNRLPDREARVEEFFLRAATLMPEQRFMLGGSGWADKAMSPNVKYIGHVPTAVHNAFNCTPKAVLNVNRASMAENGYSPPTRVFEAAGAGACLISDAWVGLELFLKDGEEVLVARDGQDVAEHMATLTTDRSKAIGAAALERVRREHTYDRRAVEVDRLLREARGARATGAAA